MNEENEIKRGNNIMYFIQGAAIGVFVGLIGMCAILRTIHQTPIQVANHWRSEIEKRGLGKSIVDTNGEYLRFEWATNVLIERH